MIHATQTVDIPNGPTLHRQSWRPDGPSRAAVLLVHGINEHSGRHAPTASYLTGRGIEVHGFDNRGHGLSGGPRVYVDSFREYVHDLEIVESYVADETGDTPLFLMGHSMGGLIAASHVAHTLRPPGRLILSSPALQIPDELSPLKQKLVGLVDKLAPKLFMGRLEIGYISRDETVQQAYLDDPLTHNKGIRARVANEILKATEDVRRHPEAFTMPLYLFHGTADRITDPAGTQWLYDNAPSKDKTIRLYDGLYHETMNEPEREVVLADLSQWILQHS